VGEKVEVILSRSGALLRLRDSAPSPGLSLLEEWISRQLIDSKRANGGCTRASMSRYA